MSIDQLARHMLDQLQITGQPQEETFIPENFDRECRLIFRYGPGRTAYQLITLIWARQPDAATRAGLRTAFNIPTEITPKFDYENGYGLTKWTWSARPPAPDTQPAQGYLFDALPQESHYTRK